MKPEHIPIFADSIRNGLPPKFDINRIAIRVTQDEWDGIREWMRAYLRITEYDPNAEKEMPRCLFVLGIKVIADLPDNYCDNP
jgi:hypothetical protein